MEIPKLNEKVAYHKQRSHRIEALADGVFAIAMTLLVLDIRVPLGEMNTETEVWFSLLHVLPKILTFIFTFLIAGLFWTTFANQFNYIHSADRNENVLAIFYLLFVSLLPFSASFLSEHLESKVAVGFYILNIFIVAQTLRVHWLYCYHNGLVKTEENNEAIIHKTVMKRANFSTTIYIIAGICCYFNSSIALGILIFLQTFFTFNGFMELIKKRKEKSTNA